ncbi:MAG: hypothetical protein R3E95_18185 [Thiolinea sp.]
MTLLKREMGFTRPEFMRILPSALHDYPYRIDGDQIHITPPESPDHTITIRLGAEAVRRIALLALPYLHVEFDFSTVDDEAVSRRFLTQFDLYYRKGGG